ncbi:MAG: response regulator [Rhodospirillaceae bacterium]|jgi:signal transduction histidine kinase/DNA-binding response OmpR family regulator/HPt (histidine-containing phosphotransfer) domain-containing protein|nr:response regulator [Rhodospirillaceae bacterium]MBT4687770.1 response regulator [Rhodospirillaceae bacterium]MBT5082806.1 response regulator [Rhodospirillaceae bacterium]MBT5524250.1 response regulator [Rhodospirillaceae bacterium]MBT5878956.1 response regulator [Rhodospirillaceae bacterium]
MRFNGTIARCFFKLLDWFIPDELRESEEEHLRLRAFVVSHACGPPFGTVIALSLIAQYPSSAAWTLLIGVLLFLIFPFLLRWTKAKREVGLGSLLHFIALIFFASYHYGGVQSPGMSWTLTVPIVAMFFVDGIYRLIGFLIYALGFVILGGLYLSGHEFPSTFGDGETGGIALVLLICAAGYVTAMALTYIGLYESSIARISLAKEDAETANRAKTELLKQAQQADRSKREAEIQLKVKDAISAELIAVMDAIDYGILLLDSDLNIRLANRAYRNIWGIPSEILVPGRPSRDLLEYNRYKGVYKLADEDWDNWLETRALPMQAGGFSPTELELADGVVLLIQCMVMPDGGRMLTYLDITSIKQNEVMLSEAKSAADAANESKSQFLASMSHEIRTPMNGVLGLSNLLHETTLNEEQAQYVDAIKNSADCLTTIINDILDFSKLEAGKLELERFDFDLSQAVQSVADLLSPQISAKSLQFEVTIGSDVPAIINGDPGRLRQILLNLTGNALKFTDDGSVGISVEMQDDDDMGVQLRFEVTDTGIGIPDDFQPKLFEKFIQADASTTRDFGGTGLGLAICKQLVEIIDGEIGMHSAVGEGTTVWFTGRFGRQSKAVDLSPDLPLAQHEVDTMPRLKILIVEDNYVNQLLATRTLQKIGHRTDIACNGVEAIKAVETMPFDVILMDVNMPVMSGLEATRLIRKMQGDKGQIPIIALTANAMKGDRERFLAAGMSDYVSKPLDRNKLIAAINKWGVRKDQLHPGPERPMPLRHEGRDRNEANIDDGEIKAKEDMVIILDAKVLDDWEKFLPAEQFRELIDAQLKGARECLHNLKIAVENGALDEVEELAHVMKSTSGSLGMCQVQAVATDLEAACGEGQGAIALEMAPNIDDAMTTAIDALGKRYGVH